MAKVLAGMTMSLDGFVEDRHGSVARLYPDFDALRQTDLLQEEMGRTGSVVMGRRAYAMAQGDFTGYPHAPAYRAPSAPESRTLAVLRDTTILRQPVVGHGLRVATAWQMELRDERLDTFLAAYLALEPMTPCLSAATCGWSRPCSLTRCIIAPRSRATRPESRFILCSK